MANVKVLVLSNEAGVGNYSRPAISGDTLVDGDGNPVGGGSSTPDMADSRLVGPEFLPDESGSGPTYTGVSTANLIYSVILHNTNTTAETVNFHIVEDSESADTTNEIYTVEIDGAETVVLEFDSPLVLDEADTVWLYSTTEDKVTCTINGKETTSSTAKTLALPTEVNIAETNVYTTPEATNVNVEAIILHNISGTTEDVSIYINGASDEATLFTIGVVAGETVVLSFSKSIVLNDDTLDMTTSTDGGVTATVLGHILE